ncbi:MAG: competence protein ComEA [Actinobacteria bacterium HGW-Actinobacteria-7]|nr:MAG: competence protein ComEA [Actinobacteria bacterium HGW-Actinobacteria-7]
MFEPLVQRIQQLAKRAGVREVPASVVVAAVAVAAVVVFWAVWNWWPTPTQGAVEFEEGPVSVATETVAAVQPSAATTACVVVHVVGCVRHPGVYELDAGSRVVDAVDAAGGSLPDAVLSAVNLARIVTDGEQIVVPDEDDRALTSSNSPPGGASSGGASAPQAQVNINTADAAALESLPGVGPSTAAKIVADRDANGPYASVDDLTRVSGIGPKKLEQLKGLACVR